MSTLPCGPSALSAASSPTRHPASIDCPASMDGVPRSPQTTVLVVDDDRKIVQLVRTYLERDGHRVVAANDGRAGAGRLRGRTTGPRGPRPDAARDGRLRGLPTDPGERRHAHPDADRPELRAGPHPRPAPGRRRLPAQALQPRRAGSARPRHPASGATDPRGGDPPGTEPDPRAGSRRRRHRATAPGGPDHRPGALRGASRRPRSCR